MLATLELVVALAIIVAAIVLFGIALPGRPLNAWLLKHPAAEAYFVPFLFVLFMIAAVAFF